ncbi:fibrobacter succinogenes major paralogous domain-containing protein [Fibrobacter sp. UBA3718]|uniref:fibrobacter succinogenes major paralogous domain-containing protein n=1 Tax=Fibrobacter sp. UBA3718 TaxID=1946531 RepID=UPI0025BCC847|nr:fibrobacter succinogenes major paralogous domain-containing protein [Fibrobacter sp. UBA3718]
MKWRILVLSAFLCLAACADDDSDFVTRPSDDSSSGVCEDCDDASSSSKKQGNASSSSSVTSSSSKGSSSSTKSSSSSSFPEGYVDPSTVVKGTITDERDGQTYKTVTIGTQTWMAENLNYESVKSFCYKDSAEYCTKYGRLYNWAAAMDSAGTWSTNGEICGFRTLCLPTYPVRGVCPEGWHLPTTTEWHTLIAAVGESDEGKILRSTSGWNAARNGTDAYSFSVLPAGYGYFNGSFDAVGERAYFWSSNQVNSDYAYSMYMYYTDDYTNVFNQDKYATYSVRCVKDDGETAETSSSKKDESSSSISPKSNSSETSVSSSSSTKDVVLSSSEGSSESKSSSSEEAESSSSKVTEPVKGTLTDSRDGQTYKTVTIGTQTWMAENLNYAYTGVPYNYSGYTSDSTSWCYSNDASNCTKYGRLYTWAAAMDSVGTWSTNGKGCGYNKTCSPTYPVRGVCPEGWHLPTQTEWKTLFTAVGGSSTAGKMLKSTSGWNSSGNGTDAYSFSALPAGLRNYNGYYDFEGYYAYFWSSTVSNGNYAYLMYLGYSYDGASLDNDGKDIGFSVRCVKD